MQQPEKSGEHKVHHTEHGFLAGFVLRKDVGLGCFDEPIA